MRTSPLEIVGREGELAALDRALPPAARAKSRVVAVSGEPGIGKSILLAELRRRAEQRGYATLEGRGTEFERDVPFGVVIDALDRRVAATERRRLESLGEECLAELASVLPSLPGPPLASGLQAERFRAYDALRVLLGELAGKHPLLLVLDDLHWADEASIEFVCHLLRQQPSCPVVLGLGYRSAGAPSRLVEAMAELEGDEALIALPLAPLSEPAAETLLGDEVAPDDRRALYVASGGNPFFLTELVRAGARRRGGPAPAGVAAAIREELADLTPDAALLLRAASVAGEPVPLELAAKIAELDAERTRGALRELVDHELLRETDVPTRLRFRHPIVRQAIYEDSGEGWRIGAHARAARALAEEDAPATTRAHHVERSARWGDEEGIAVLTDAAHLAAARAPATAATWLSAALRLLPPAASPDRRLSLLVPLAGALGASARYGDARASLIEALDLVPEELVVVRARLVGAVARLDHMLGRHTEARSLLFETLHLLAERSEIGVAALHLELAVDYWLAPDWVRMREHAELALDESRALDEPVLSAAAAAILGLAAYYLGDTQTAERSIREASPAIDGLSDGALAGRIEALLCLGHAELGMEHYAAAAEHLERGIAIARSTGQNPWFVLLMCLFGVTELWRGRLDAAARTAVAAAESAQLSAREPLIWARTLQCWVATLRGDILGAVRLGEQAVDLLGGSSEFIFGWLAHCCLGAALLEAGEPVRAKQEILDNAGGPSLALVEPSWHTRWYEVLALAELGVGDVNAAEEWVRRAEANALELGLVGRLADAARARAAVELARGSHDRALTAARDAVELLAEVGRTVDGARAGILLGRALVGSGDQAGAEEELKRAHAVLDACGAHRYRDEAARELRRLGHRVARPAGRRVTAAGDLTPREREVAELVARGRTNHEIADDLFMSNKTVETHLSRIFEKLAVSSRSALASAIERGRG
jgi:DNA-binding CsgD family transcriptional regulator/tetratricopeptide (TPR) repeat protein